MARERFVEAARLLLEAQPFDAVTDEDIARQAGRPVDAFHSRFEGKDAVLRLLAERHLSRFRDVARAYCDPVRWEGLALDEFVNGWVRVNTASLRRTLALSRAVVDLARRDERLRADVAATKSFTSDQFVALMVSRGDELPVDDVRSEAERANRLNVAVLEHMVMTSPYGAEGGAAGPDEELVTDLVVATCRILGIPLPA